MIKKILLIVLTTASLTANSQIAPPSPYVRSNIDWIQYFSQRDAVANSASAIDGNSNVYLTGYSTPSGTLNADMVTLMYDSTGALIYSQPYDNGAYDCGNAVRVDGLGNCVVTGTSYDATTKFDFVTAKYSASGTLSWLVRFDGGIANTDESVDLKIDVNSDVYVLGRSKNSAGNFDIKVLKYDGSSGSIIWQQTYNPNNLDDEGVALVLSSDGLTVLVTGNITDAANGTDIAIFAVDATSGSMLWTSSINGSTNGNDRAAAIILSGANVVVCGKIINSNPDYTTAKYDISSGTQLFQSDYAGSSASNEATSLVRDSTGNIAVTGKLLDPSTFFYSYHTILYDSTGAQIWVNIENTGLTALTVDPKIASDSIANHFYVSGEVMKTTKDIMAYQITPTGNTSWKEVIDGQNSDVDAATNLLVNGIGVIYLSALSKNSSAEYDITTIKISQTPVYFPPDFNNEPANTGFLLYENKGQLVDVNDSLTPQINFYTRSRPEMYFDNTSISYVFTRFDTLVSTVDTARRVDLTFPGCNSFAKPYAYYNTQGYLNYYLSNCPSGITGVRGFERSITPNIFPNIDLHYYSNSNGIKYYFVVKPGGDPNRINMKFDGAVSTSTVGSGYLTINAGIGDLQYDPPIAYQVALTGTVVSIVPITAWSADYIALGSDTYRFRTGAYNPLLPLVIEVNRADGTSSPLSATIEWGTMYGGNKDDVAYDIATDPSGNLYATGATGGGTFPIFTGISTFTLPYGGGFTDAFVSKFDVNYSRKYTIFYGGNNYDRGYGITFDSQNNKLYVCGQTVSSASTFPTQALAGSASSYQDNSGGGGAGPFGKGFLLRFNTSSGAREWATKFGGNGETPATRIEADASGNIFVAGTAAQAGYTNNCSVGASGEMPICNPGGGAYVQDVNKSATYGSSTDNNFYQDCYLAKFNSQTQLTWSTLFGGRGDDYVGDIAIDIPNQKLYFVGSTRSIRVGSPSCTYTANASFPLCTGTGYFQQDLNTNNTGTNPKEDGFISKFSLGGVLEWSTYFGGTNTDEASGVVVDNSGNIFISGESNTNTYSNNSCALATNGGFPFCAASGYTQAFSGGYDAYISKFDNSGNIAWCSFYGGSADEDGIEKGGTFKLALKANNNEVFVVGNTRSCTGFPLSSSANYYSQSTHADAGSCANGATDGYILDFNSSGARQYASYFGGTGSEVGLLPNTSDVITSVATFQNRVYVCGKTYATSNFPLNAPATGNPYLQAYTTTLATSYSDAFYGQIRLNSTAVGINENNDLGKNESSLFKLYPNPAANAINMEWNNITPNDTKAEVFVYNIMGQAVKHEETRQNFGLNTTFVKLDGLSPGVYIAVIKTRTQALNAKFIKE